MDARAEALLYAADRAQHVAEVIAPALEAGKIVISDRFVDSSLAYQGLARGLGLDDIYRISEWGTGGVLPDLAFFLDVDPESGLGRVGERRDRLEQEETEFHRRVRRAYRELSRRFPARFVVIDASRTPSEVHQDIVTAFKQRLEERPERASPIGTPGHVPR